ncbi:MAG: hypothetical protein LBQ86_00325 [Holophagales bacterium]|jgi:hypothetical protein|nr:hypothetical protein [Holophagales bacterium]
MLELEYTYTEQPSGWLVGRLDMYPNYPTQGKDAAELEVMLADIYAIMQDEKVIRVFSHAFSENANLRSLFVTK